MWRGLKEGERTTVRRSLDRWGAFPLAERFRMLARVDGGTVDVFLTTPEVFKFVILHQPYTAGIQLGTLRRRGLRLCLQGAVLVALESKERVVRVNEKAGTLFCYGRDIFGESVLETKPELRQNDVCIVGNDEGDALGLGRLEVAGERLKEKRLVIVNIADLGQYLRTENKSRQISGQYGDKK